MIRTYRSKALRRFVELGDASKLSVPNIRRVERIVTELDSANLPEDMNIPGLRLHRLKGKDKGRYASMRRAIGASHLVGTAMMPSTLI
jgi:toxin HigB-1